ncbi:hypothetical protein GDO81_023804 [Engystomops pustulosus]|uniref:glucuronosyltransferase n=1 Tax=Engystomops pustulosus TaxID=76066 RepID=A0AAV6ZHI0_ENGPU|nr:hypothetical protein GDO81_023804 [Engystomops pustulosus]
MNQTDILDFLKQENYDIAIVDPFNPCHLLIVEKLGIPYIAFFPGPFSYPLGFWLPSPPSYVPMYVSGFTDRMNFLERVINTFLYLGSNMVEIKNEEIFRRVIEEHFPPDSRPSLSDLYHKAELWIYNMDFSIEFPRPLLPHIQYISGLRAKPAKPVSQDLEDFIAESGDSGFILVTLGSMVSTIPRTDLIKEMNSAFASVPQKIIWRYKASQWPEDLKLAPNVRLLDWVPQNDLLAMAGICVPALLVMARTSEFESCVPPIPLTSEDPTAGDTRWIEQLNRGRVSWGSRFGNPTFCGSTKQRSSN